MFSRQTVQLPHQQAVELPCPGIQHELVQPWSAGLGAADDVLVGVHDLPALPVGVLLDFSELEFVVPVGGADAGVDGGPKKCCTLSCLLPRTSVDSKPLNGVGKQPEKDWRRRFDSAHMATTFSTTYPPSAISVPFCSKKFMAARASSRLLDIWL